MKAVSAFLLAFFWVSLLSSIGLCANGRNAYGINAHIPGEPLLDLARQAGIGWIRVDFNWYMIEPGKGDFQWALFDDLVSLARQRGLKIFATLAFTPSWANEGKGMTHPPRDPQDWYDFVFSVVDRYRGEIGYWGMWNEPNLEKFWAGTREQYRDWIIKGGSAAAREADGSSQTVAPGLAHIAGTRWWEWLGEILAGDGKAYVDIVSHHCYAGSAEEVTRLLERGDAENPSVRAVLRQTGAADKPFWLTETGWHTGRRSLEEDWAGPPLPGHHYRIGEVSEEVQAYHYRRLCWDLIQRDWVDRVFFYELRDDPNPAVDHWGILRADNTPKQAYYAYRDFIANPREPEPPAGGCTCRTGPEVAREDPDVLQNLILQGLFGVLMTLYIRLLSRKGIPASGYRVLHRPRTGKPEIHMGRTVPRLRIPGKENRPGGRARSV